MATTFATANLSTAARRGGLAGRIEGIRTSYAQWRVYRRTVAELSALSDRDLSDLGLGRASIRAVALEAAYGA